MTKILIGRKTKLSRTLENFGKTFKKKIERLKEMFLNLQETFREHWVSFKVLNLQKLILPEDFGTALKHVWFLAWRRRL